MYFVVDEKAKVHALAFWDEVVLPAYGEYLQPAELSSEYAMFNVPLFSFFSAFLRATYGVAEKGDTVLGNRWNLYYMRKNGSKMKF